MPHKDAVTQQFDRTAESYRTSAVHAQGSDLALFARHAQAARPQRALDVGCGAGHAAYAVAPFCAGIDAADASEAMLAVVADEARRRGLAHLRTVCAHVEQLPYPDRSVDLVTCRYSAHHWADLGAGLREIHRVLRQGGLFLVTDSAGADDALTDTHMQTVEILRDRTHVRSYRLPEWEEALRQHGFTVETSERMRVRLTFADWVARAQTPADRVTIIRDILTEAPAEVRSRLDVQNDGSFLLDVVTLVARA
ncbi:MAG: class I SAM-dependent methyltransferase [Gammaproteobacteria bacterium]|nr:class I SAM-dependent methyltransferase [Gammaproteobacteria bacterium]